MDKNGVLTISNFQKGQADSAYLGFDTMRNINITAMPGVAMVSQKAELQYSTSGIPVGRLYDSTGDTWVLCDTGSTSILLKNGVYYTDVVGQARDIIEYKDYVIISAGSALHCVKVGGGSSYFSNWITGFDANSYLKMIVSKSDTFLYITNGVNIKRVSNFAHVSPSVAPTYTLDTSAILPFGYYAVTMTELGSKLMVGTQTTSRFETRTLSTSAVIFPYRIGSSSTNFEDPVTITNANCIHQMITSNNIVYFTAGNKGNVYITNGVTYSKVVTIPFNNRPSPGVSVDFYPNAIKVDTYGNLIIGTSNIYTGRKGDTQYGIYEVNLGTGKYEINLKNTISNGLYSGTQGTFGIGFIDVANTDTYYWGWRTTTGGGTSTYGVDYTNVNKCTGYTSVIETQLFVVGNKLTPKRFENIEFTFGIPLTLDQGIKAYYRTDTISDWNLLGTWDFATYGGQTSIRDTAYIPATPTLQIRLELNCTSSISLPYYLENIELLSVTIW